MDWSLFWVAFWGVLEIGGGIIGMFLFAFVLYELTRL